MMLHRYGGGVGTDSVERILWMPVNMIVRLMGCALVASGGRREPGSNVDHEAEANIIRMLEERARKAGAEI